MNTARAVIAAAQHAAVPAPLAVALADLELALALQRDVAGDHSGIRTPTPRQ